MSESRFFQPAGGPYATGPADGLRGLGGAREPMLSTRGQGAPHQPQDLRHAFDAYDDPAARYAPDPVWTQPVYGHVPQAPVHGAAVRTTEPLYQPAGRAGMRAVPRSGGVLHGLGAVLSLALIVGAAGWVWQLMQRDVAGVPVVRALEGPSRVLPADPGGRQAAHQGLSINELAAAGEETPRDQIVLAPAPVDLRREDSLAARVLTPDPEFGLQAELQPIPAALQQEVAMPAAQSGLGLNNPTARAVTSSLRPPARGTAQSAPVQSAGTQPTTAQVPAPQAGAPAGFLDDIPLQGDLAESLALAVASGLSGPRNIDVDPASIGPGTRLVQLGAYDDVDAARAAWDQLARRFSPLLDDRGRVIEAAHSGSSVFFRLRAHGFSDERDARRFCAALVDQQVDCIPVLIR
ncbi:MAG: SPOR domain-containing protein [Roseinatronobacter sp.]